MSKKLLFLRWILPLALLFGGIAAADTVKLRADHPDRYVVARGDTLWDISGRFLKDPWLWPEIWEINPEIDNPHLIYPGDIIRLEFVQGRPVLTVERGGASGTAPGGSGVVRLSPQPRFSTLQDAIPTIPIDAIEQFLKYPRIVSEEELEDSGYVVANEEGRLISGTGHRVYARGLNGHDIKRYAIVRRGEVYRSALDHGDILGYEAIHVGDVRLTESGKPSTLLITRADREVLKGDRLLPVSEEEMDQHFVPHAPETPVEGQIISVLDGISRIGQYQIVAIDRGVQDNLEVGHVLAVYQTGDTVRDTVAPKRMGRKVRLPNERAGTLMVIRLFDRVSYALVMEATRDLRVFDTVTNP